MSFIDDTLNQLCDEDRVKILTEYKYQKFNGRLPPNNLTTEIANIFYRSHPIDFTEAINIIQQYVLEFGAFQWAGQHSISQIKNNDELVLNDLINELDTKIREKHKKDKIIPLCCLPNGRIIRTGDTVYRTDLDIMCTALDLLFINNCTFLTFEEGGNALVHDGTGSGLDIKIQ